MALFNCLALNPLTFNKTCNDTTYNYKRIILMNSRDLSQEVIFCAICGFTSMNIRKLVFHLDKHQGSIFVCGIDNCCLEFRSACSFKTHLINMHPYFFPYLTHGLPYFSENSIFTSTLQPSINSGHILPIDNVIFNEVSQNIDNVLPQQYDINTKNFFEILVANGLKNNITFKGLKELSSSLVDFFASLSDCEQLGQYAQIFKNSIYTSDRFDSNLEKYFNVNFPQVIN